MHGEARPARRGSELGLRERGEQAGLGSAELPQPLERWVEVGAADGAVRDLDDPVRGGAEQSNLPARAEVHAQPPAIAKVSARNAHA
jgi:hypothetical protein